MKKYIEYMDGVAVSDTLHQRLVELEAPARRAPAWKRYGAVAAALVLVCGLGGAVWAAHINGLEPAIPFYPTGFQGTAEIADDPIGDDPIGNDPIGIGGPLGEPDIAPEDPNEAADPSIKTIGGYEVVYGGLSSYYVLPYIEYGAPGGVEACLDWDVPPGSVKRDLTQEEIIALLGGTDAVYTHLGWEAYQLSGWAAWLEDGSFWGAYIDGLLVYYGGPGNQFEFAVTADQLPPTCFAYPGSVEQEIWGMTVTADGYEWELKTDGPPYFSGSISERRVSFMKDGFGYRFEMSSADPEAAEKMVSRLVARIAGEGLALDAITADGAVLAHPWEADPNYSVGEPNWVDDYDAGCPYCADGAAHTHPYDPREAADPSYNAP